MGDWRIDIVTNDDQILGRINFEILPFEKIIPEFETIEK
jgi:hypothetical protein